MGAQPCIVIATPCFGAMVHQGYMLSVLRLVQHAAGRYALNLHLLGHDSLITRSRNTLVARFLDTPEATHLLFIDADIAFRPEQVDRLLAAGRDVVAGMYPLKVFDWARADRERSRGEDPATAGLLYVGAPCEGAALERDGDFVTATYAGTGFMLIRRAALERMAAAYPETRYRAIHAHPAPAGASPHQYALFDGSIDADGTYLSEDYTFCRRWRAIGGQVWLDTAGALTHIGLHDFAGDPAARFGSVAPQQAKEAI
ncbi:hypothetical protein M0638_21920 [Roseomonas sp. NAR14]|uniref:Uncharacterized protein n=1 Tax=Roseomonas acroporae TaxID=2937791 RepID=A0A9X1YIY1_9PROT|nr:hypothetical protein [Roseomonas acroporae]MCK8787036.1 hypothetical protein [Roseomonas acroporae]